MIILAIDQNYNYLYFNQEHRNVMKYAYDVDVELGMNMMDCITSEIDRQHSKENYDLAFSGVSHSTIQEYGDTNISYYESFYNPIYDGEGNIIGTTAYARDITTRIVTQKKLAESEERLDMFFRQSLTGFFIMMCDEPIVWNDSIDKEKALDIIFTTQHVTRTNQAYLDQYGYDEQEMIQKTPNDMFEHDLSHGREAWKEMLDRGSYHTITRERTKAGRDIYIEGDYICMYNENGEFIGHFGTQQDITERVEKEQKIIYMNQHDYLTGLFNREYFLKNYENMDVKRNYPLGIMMMDINGLKIINDAYGNAKGDKALKIVANILLKHTRKNYVLARVGGDEFALIIPKANLDSMQELKERIRKEVEKTRIDKLYLSLSCGYELKENPSQSREDILRMVENRMFSYKTIEGKSSRNRTIKAILSTLNDKFETEKKHSSRVSTLCRSLGDKMGLHEDALKGLEMAGLFHDIGKISVPDIILNKPDKLTNEEYSLMKTHTEIGYQILRAADEYSDLAIHALHHHERWDGKGYPSGISGEHIPLFSRIIGVVDAYEAMTANRPYRKRRSKKEAVEEIIKNAGTQFDPEIAKVFVTKVLRSKWIDATGNQ